MGGMVHRTCAVPWMVESRAPLVVRYVCHGWLVGVSPGHFRCSAQERTLSFRAARGERLHRFLGRVLRSHERAAGFSRNLLADFRWHGCLAGFTLVLCGGWRHDFAWRRRRPIRQVANPGAGSSGLDHGLGLAKLFILGRPWWVAGHNIYWVVARMLR